MIYTLAYPLCLLVCLGMVFFLQWSSIYWCEQMWKSVVVIRVMETQQC